MFSDVRTFLGHQFFGDSMLVRLGRHIEASAGMIVDRQRNGKGREIYAACTGGATAQELKKKLRNNKALVAGVPTLLLVGTNDILRGTQFDLLLRDVAVILRSLKRRGSTATVMLVPPIPQIDPRSPAEGMRQEFNKRLRVYAEQLGMRVIDVQPLFLWGDGAIKMHLYERFMGANRRPDLIHWNKAGMEVVASVLRWWLTAFLKAAS